MSEYVSIEEFNALKALVDSLISKVSNLETELSETKVLLDASLKRTFRLETAIFSHDSDGDIIFDAKDNPILSIATEKSINEPEPDTPISPETTLDMKACEVVKYLKEELKHNDFGESVLNKKEFSEFMTTKIPTELRVKNVTRQLKADIFERATKLFPNLVYIKTSPSGNKTKSLALKTSGNRTNTNACSRLTGLGIWA